MKKEIRKELLNKLKKVSKSTSKRTSIKNLKEKKIVIKLKKPVDYKELPRSQFFR